MSTREEGGRIDTPFLREDLFAGETRNEGSARRPAALVETPFLLAFEGGGPVPIAPAPAEPEPAGETEAYAYASETDPFATEEEEAYREEEASVEEWVESFHGEETDYAEREGYDFEAEGWDEPVEEESFAPESYGFEEESAFDDAFREEPAAGAETLFPEEEGEWEADPVALELESPPGAPAEISEFAASLGEEWSRRRGGSPTGPAIAEWLLRDYQETLTGARLRFGKQKHVPEAIGRAWMVSRREQMGFQLQTGIQALGKFDPPPGAVTLVTTPLVEKSDEERVAPLTVRFVEALKRTYPKWFAAKTYRGHGGGSFDGKGYSLDLYLGGGEDSRGFYHPQEAIRFVRAVGEAAAAVGLEWRVLYNDFTVADAINRETGLQRVIFMGTVTRKKGEISSLNWHGPDPLVLHFHLDLGHRSGPAGKPSTGAAKPAATPVPAPASVPAASATPAPPAAPAAPGAVPVSEKTVAAVGRYRPLAEAASRRYGVDAALILGVIAAESGGNPALVAKSGYTGLMQAGKGEAHKRPATSIDEGARKLRDFRVIMEGVLKARGRSYDALPEAERLRLLALAYNAGPVTVAKALQYAAEAGRPERWLDGEHYRRALLFTGAYSLSQAAGSCLKGVGAAEQAARRREAARARDHWRLGTKSVNWRKLPDPPAWSQAAPGLPAFLACAIDFKHRNAPGYAARILAYRDRFRAS